MRIKTPFLLLFLTLAGGCVGETRPEPLDSGIQNFADDIALRKEMLKHIPFGTPLAEATEKMETYGFRHNNLFSIGISPYGSFGERFTKTDSPGSLLRSITVNINHEEGKVTDITVGTFYSPPISPGTFVPDLNFF